MTKFLCRLNISSDPVDTLYLCFVSTTQFKHVLVFNIFFWFYWLWLCSRDAFFFFFFVATRSVYDIYQWYELPQVSFLSRQTRVCHDKRCVLCLSRQPRREFGDVSCHPPVWNLRAVIRFPFPISSLGFFLCLVLLLFLSCNVSANGPFSFLYPPRKLQYFSFCMALVEQLGDDSW